MPRSGRPPFSVTARVNARVLALLSFSLSVLLAAGGALLARPALSGPPAAIERSLQTPRSTMEHFLLSARSGDYARAAFALDLGALPPERRGSEGPRVARQLKQVLDQKLWIDLEALSAAPEGDPKDGVDVEHIGSIPLGLESVPITLRRARLGGALVWRVSSETLQELPRLYEAYGPRWIEGWLPSVLVNTRVWEMELWQCIGLLLALGLGYAVALLLASFALRVGHHFAERTDVTWDDALVEHLKGPTRFLLFTFVVWPLTRPLSLAAPAQELTDKLLQVGLVFSLAFFAQRGVRFAASIVEERAMKLATGGARGDLEARGVRTQVLVLRRVASIIIWVLAVSLALVQFDVVKTVGVSLLASAGVAGIVLGLAAQRSIATLLAGIQLSVTQPIRIGDTVIVENEWGTIEEINLTYVVVRIWDQRRLVVPMSKFLDQSFQNWTKVSPELLGTVSVWADFRLPVEAAREELARILDDNPRFDGRASGVQIVGCTDRTMEVRALVSSKDAGDLWDLRCEVREKLLRWLATYEDGRYLPRTRLEGEGVVEG